MKVPINIIFNIILNCICIMLLLTCFNFSYCNNLIKLNALRSTAFLTQHFWLVNYMKFVFWLQTESIVEIFRLPSQELHNHYNNVSDWFKTWHLIRFDQSVGSSQGIKYDAIIVFRQITSKHYYRQSG